jgi:hypothetical protein
LDTLSPSISSNTLLFDYEHIVLTSKDPNIVAHASGIMCWKSRIRGEHPRTGPGLPATEIRAHLAVDQSQSQDTSQTSHNNFWNLPPLWGHSLVLSLHHLGLRLLQKHEHKQQRANPAITQWDALEYTKTPSPAQITISIQCPTPLAGLYAKSKGYCQVRCVIIIVSRCSSGLLHICCFTPCFLSLLSHYFSTL